MSLTPHTFPHLDQIDALSPQSLKNHLALYSGYVDKFNQLHEKLHQLQSEKSPSPDSESVKTDLTFALGAIKNHELFFNCLGEEWGGDEPVPAPLAEQLIQSFHSLPQFLIDLKRTAQLGRGWAFTAYDLDLDCLFNFHAGADHGLPVNNALPILTLDLYGHAYFYDFGNNKTAYIEALIKSLRWPHIASRLATAKKLRQALTL